MKAELEKLFYELFLKKKPNLNDKALHVGSVMLSWAIYGAAVDWQKNRSLSAKDYFEQALPFISKGSMGKRFPYYLPFYSLNRLEWEYRGRGG
jgi:hypothetical protein